MRGPQDYRKPPLPKVGITREALALEQVENPIPVEPGDRPAGGSRKSLRLNRCDEGDDEVQNEEISRVGAWFCRSRRPCGDRS